MSSPLPERFVGQDLSGFFFYIYNVSVQNCLQFLYLYPPQQCAPLNCSSHLSIFILLSTLFPPVPPLILPAFVLNGVKFLLCFNFWKNQVLPLFPWILKLVLFSLRTAKDAAKATISVHAAQLETPPFRQPPISCSPIANPRWTPGPFESTPKPSNNQDVLSVYNKSMDEIATEISCERVPLNS